MMSSKRLGKRLLILEEDSDSDDGKFYRFKVLLPNGTSIGLTLRNPEPEMSMESFVKLVKEEYDKARVNCGLMRKRKQINWSSGAKFYLEDANDKKMRERVSFGVFKPNKCHIIRLHDGSGDVVDTFENMWDLTPDTDLLKELPEDYTFETALADLIDNSLQAVWSNTKNQRKLICVDVLDDCISIFDTGTGMDGSDGNSIAKWGKMGASVHRSSKPRAIGGKPPYLTPFFGMFGYGGPIATMHLGRYALVSSKTKESKKVYTLNLEREALINRARSGVTWRTDGGIRDPLEKEIELSPHGSFTKVEIFEPKLQISDVSQLQCKLKDIYFPYIQCDEISKTGKTETPIEFQVNGVDLAEIEGGEVAITNLHSCNGPEFSFQLRFSVSDEKKKGTSHEANARLKFVYFPIIEGKESTERILESLEEQGCKLTESYKTFSRVSVRRLGRLLPDVRWVTLPFMDLKEKRGTKACTLKTCCSRVKCFIDTDAGFNPTPSKTNLAHQNPFSVALRNFGLKQIEKEKDVEIQIHRGGKALAYTQLEREFQEWILEMHNRYDEAAESGEDDAILITGPLDKKALGISADVVRVHSHVKRKGKSWKHGQNIKILKGACPGVHKNNVYATVDYFLLEGFHGEAGGDARIICRPINLSEKEGCTLLTVNGNPSLELRSSLSLPFSIIDSGKCIPVSSDEWNSRLEKQREKVPSKIDLLNERHCQELDIDGALPVDASVLAGEVPPDKIVAVVRPASFNFSTPTKSLDQKHIVKMDKEMHMVIELVDRSSKSKRVHHIFSQLAPPSSLKGFHGVYIFSLGSKFPDLFKKAGVYNLSFSIGESINCTKTVSVKASARAGSWKLLDDQELMMQDVLVGSNFPPCKIACYDKYDNKTTFTSLPRLAIELIAGSGFQLQIRIDKGKASLMNDGLILKIENIVIQTSELDRIRPSYRANLKISSKDELLSVLVACKVKPGPLQHVVLTPPKALDKLLPDFTIENLTLEMFDGYGNHLAEGTDITLHVEGLRIQDRNSVCHKVDDCGCVDLSGLLKVTAGYGKSVSLSVLSGNKQIFKKASQIVKRELRLASENKWHCHQDVHLFLSNKSFCKPVPPCCNAGSHLENIIFEVTDANGTIDTNIHDNEEFGQSHTLVLRSDSTDTGNVIRYTFVHGRCKIPSLTLPRQEGLSCFEASHSRHPELHTNLKIQLMHVPKLEPDETEARTPTATLTPRSDNRILPYEASPSSITHQANIMCVLKHGEVLMAKLHKYGIRNGELEEQLKSFQDQEAEIEQDLSIVQASLEPLGIAFPECLSTKEAMMREIEENHCESAASVFCSLQRNVSLPETQAQFKDVLGSVVLLGTVGSTSLSRILSEYLGKETLLALVCKSFEAASSLEQYGPYGGIAYDLGLHAEAANLGRSITNRFHVICLEGIRAWNGSVMNDPQGRLALCYPMLPDGSTLPGFRGYAVNMINLGPEELKIRTLSGHGLRETLFYSLFGLLQIYDARKHLEAALPYINHGAAVSLDGAIFRENGCVSLGSWRPEIHFPITIKEEKVEISREIEAKKCELSAIRKGIAKTNDSRQIILKKFDKKKKDYLRFLGDLEPAVKQHYLEYNQHEEHQ